MPSDVEHWISGLELIQTAHCTHIFDSLLPTPGTAQHFFSVLRTFFAWCEQRRMQPRSPLYRVAPPAKTRSRERTLSTDELKAVWKTAEAMDHPYGVLVRLLLLTGQRRGEIVALRRSWVSEQARTVTLPKEITKNGLEHTFSIGEKALVLLQAVSKGSDLYFPARTNAQVPMSGWGKWKIEIQQNMPRGGLDVA